MESASGDVIDGPSRPRGIPTSTSTTERVVEALRNFVIEGSIAPGTRISEQTFSSALDVSRNTLRVAFRVLAHERLLVHEMNRGVFVRQLTARDVDSIYQFRSIVEVAAVRDTTRHSGQSIRGARRAVDEGLAALQAEDWRGLGTANMHFHRAIASLSGNERIDAAMSQLLAELRLAFHVMTPLRSFHEPYLEDNLRICSLVEQGDGNVAAAVLTEYLARARLQLIAAYER
ncbi:MAG: GntR family transcriptional regulator [Acidimicrobiia bacterium]